MTDLLVIDDGVVSAMISSNSYRKAFPFIEKAAAARNASPGGCSRCKRKQVAHQNEVNSINAVKAAIATMPASRKVVLKRMLDASKLRVRYVDTAGVHRLLTF